MFKNLIKVVGVVAMSSTLAACSASLFQSDNSGPRMASNSGERAVELSGAPVADSAPLGGNIQASMDENDRNKLSRALDSGIGKESHWTSSATGISYTVVPTRKISVGDNNLCRKYSITATRGGSKKQVSGSACVGSDGSWHTV